MRIGFDVSQTGRSKAGCGYFADGLIRALAAVDPGNEYVLYPAFGDLFWDPECATATWRGEGPRFTSLAPPAGFEESRRFWRHPGPDFEARIGGPDLVHSNNFFCPIGLERARLVYTLHDLSFLEDPSWTTEANRVGCVEGMFRAATRADWMVANSEYTRRHFLAVFPHYPAERTEVVHPASRFTGEGGVPRPERFRDLTPEGFWLSVGSIEPRKNQRRLAEAYAKARGAGAASLPLVLAGGAGWLMDDFAAFLRDLGVAQEVILTGYVSDRELEWLYRNCFAFLYPSLFEGFGMPVLEALSLGAPVICSRTTSLPEVAGEAALLMDPLETESIAGAMRQMACGEVSREALRQAGYRQARRFRWEDSARKLLGVYERAANGPRCYSESNS